MRKKIVAGNWKMNKNLSEGIALAKELNDTLCQMRTSCRVIIGVPFVHLASIASVIDRTQLGLAAQDCADRASGAYTGEVSAAMIASTGAQYVILGHSERRAYYGETSEKLVRKVDLALANGLIPIFCVGELLEDREAGSQFDVVTAQLREALFHLPEDLFARLIIAYEPVWAIGTGRTASADQAEEMHACIRRFIAEKYGREVAEAASILYGGSCSADNAKELFACPNVDGGLIGGASLSGEKFIPIIAAR